MPSHLALLSCLLVLVVSLDKFLLVRNSGKRWFSGGGVAAIIPRIPTSRFKSQRSMAAAAKWSETTMLVIDMQVVREHDPSGRDVELFCRHLYSGGKGPTVKGLKGAELAGGLFIKEGDYKLVKTRFSAFFATHLDSLLKTLGMKNLVITVYDAVALDYEKVMVLTDATAAARPDIHLGDIRDMKTIGVETPTLEEWRR
ncbi:hypothetical protein VPH35_066163 [Triticum aestivum]